MVIYIIITILTFLLLYPAQYCYKEYTIIKNSKIKKSFCLKGFYILLCFIFFFIAFQPYFLISGLRFGPGTDFFEGYSEIFNYTLLGGEPMIEVGFSYFLELLTKITINPQWLFIVTSFIFCFFMFWAIKRYTKHFAIAGSLILACGLLFDSFNNIRQSISLAIGILGLSYASERKYGRSVILLALAYSFHRTALAIIPLYILAGIKPIRKFYPIIAFVLVALAPFYIDIFKFILSGTEYASYFDWQPTKSGPIWFYFFQQLLVFVFIFFNYKGLYKKHESIFIVALANTIAIIIAILMLRYRHLETMFRAYRWFSWSSIFIIPYMLDLDVPKGMKVVYVVGSVTMMILMTNYTIYRLHYHEVYPYNFYDIFSKEKAIEYLLSIANNLKYQSNYLLL